MGIITVGYWHRKRDLSDEVVDFSKSYREFDAVSNKVRNTYLITVLIGYYLPERRFVLLFSCLRLVLMSAPTSLPQQGKVC